MQFSTLPVYQAPVEIGKDPIVSIAHWDDAYKSFEAKEYKKSLIAVLNYINPDLLKKVDTSGDVEINQSHGSAEVKVSITDTKFKISAPFLKIEKANKVALMRRVNEINFTPLNLAQIALKENVLWFDFECELALCQPNKIYEVVREVCVYADDYDDEFIEKYKAEFYHQVQTIPLSRANEEKVWKHFQDIAEQHSQYLEYFEQKRWRGSVWDILVISILNVANMPCINGSLRTELAEELYHLYNSNIDGDYRIDRAKNYLKNLFTKYSREKFIANAYGVEKFISLKFRSSSKILQNEFEQSKERIAQEINDGSHFAAAYSIYLLLLRILYEYNLDEGHKLAITQALEQAGGKESNEALVILQDIYVKFLEGTIDANKPKGFFGKLFG